MRPLLPLIPVLLAAPLVAQGKPDFELRRELASGKRLYLQNIIGDVHVTGGTGRTVEITAVKKAGRYGEPAGVAVETLDLDDGVAVCVRYPGQGRRRPPTPEQLDKNPCSSGDWDGDGWNDRSRRNDTRVSFTVRVPAGLTLHAGTVSGDVLAERLEGELEIRSVSGDVRLTGASGRAIDLETVSGDVELADVRSKDVSGHTVSGEISFAGPIEDEGTYDFSSTSGDITVRLPARPNASLKAATFSGRLSSDLPISPDDSRRRRHRYAATWGSGSARLDLETLSGDLVIRVGNR
jgi:putative adhesin